MPHELSIVHLIREPTSPYKARPPLLLTLHGLRGNEGDLMKAMPGVDEDFFRVSVRGPYPVGQDAYAWYHVRFAPEGPQIRTEEADSSRLALLGFIDELVEAYGLDAGRVYLMGFSQGAIMSLSIALTHPEKVAGVVAMSGRIASHVVPLIVSPDRLRSLSIFVVHGTEDKVLPIEHGRATRDRLSRLPFDLEYREYAMGHEITSESLKDISDWLRARIET